MSLSAVALCTGLAAAGGAPAADLNELGTTEAAEAIRSGRVTSRALVEASLSRAIEKQGLNALIRLDRDGALQAADAVDAAIAAGTPVGPLAGVPIVVKDNIAFAGLPTTAGTPGLKDFVPARTAPVLQALLDAGAVLLAKANMHELAYGVTSDNAAYGRVGNAVDPALIAGGSSGGTGAAIGAGMAPAGLGTDTGASVRLPAALNGIAGLRPTLGRYPVEGIVPISRTRDTPGPMARTVADLVLLDGVITGADTAMAPAQLSGVRLGVPHPFVDDLSPATAEAFAAMLGRLERAGAVLVELDMSDIAARTDAIGMVIAAYETGTDIPAFLAAQGIDLTIRELADQIASPDVKAIFDTAILGDDAVPEPVYRAAMETERPAIQAAYAAMFAGQDLAAIAFPTSPTEPFALAGDGSTMTLNGRDLPLFPTLTRNVGPGSVVGIPGLSIPAGRTATGLPVGLELDGPAGSDRSLLALGLAIEALD